jgi:protein-S-isoprenylcysteine O-methyltransferase
MTGLALIANLLMGGWLGLEVWQIMRSRRVSGKTHDAGTFAGMWWTVAATVVVANLAGAWASRHGAAFGLSSPLRTAGVGLMVMGIAFRFYAVGYLGRYFTVRVAIQQDHRLIDTGPYRWLRHPSYTGAWLAFIGVGLVSGTWPSLAIWALLPLTSVMRRIRVEEATLVAYFGDRYVRYQHRTWCLIPWMF